MLKIIENVQIKYFDKSGLSGFYISNGLTIMLAKDMALWNCEKQDSFTLFIYQSFSKIVPWHGVE